MPHIFVLYFTERCSIGVITKYPNRSSPQDYRSSVVTVHVCLDPANRAGLSRFLHVVQSPERDVHAVA